MEYIRTKDGIYELNPPDYESPMCLDGKTITTCVYTKNHEWIAKSDILKQSDNLKELFDELVIYNPDNDGHFYSKIFVFKGDWEIMLKPMNDYEKSKGVEIYGAIWVFDDNGAPILKPVAKKNEKGDLKLL